MEKINDPVDLERWNFLAWYPRATPEDIALARKNNSEKLDELIRKYAHELELMKTMYGLAPLPALGNRGGIAPTE